ncbi:MAG: hypothetical protein QNL34_04305, partial [OM182 bacterium]
MNLAQKPDYARGLFARLLTLLFTLLLTLLLAFITLPAFAASAGFEFTALDRYVQAPDDNYRYEVVE